MIKKLIRSIAAGISISLGCIIFLVCENKIVGSLFFSIGIMIVMEFKFLLFTGYVPVARKNEKNLYEYLINSIFVFIGNLLGAMLTAFLISLTRIKDVLITNVDKLSNIKMSDNLLSIFVLSIFCGIIIAAIVKANNLKKQVLYVALMIACFILSSYEHVVANAFYLTLSKAIFSWHGLLFMLVCLLGNFCGGFLFSFIENLETKKEDTTTI